MDEARYTYALTVEQQPQRARMCGFGDKDRRPITPPPCVRLRIIDNTTGNEVDITHLDISFYILTVDLWDEDSAYELNLVVHPTSLAHPNESTDPTANDYVPPIPIPKRVDMSDSLSSHLEQLPGDQEQSSAHRPGSSTRNLIGNLVASASKLNDPHEELGIWFVLQDLSVRTEGTFRLKFNFVDLSTATQSLLTSGSSPVLSSVFSDAFSVYSAKRFPGMIESTDISRKFSHQGIKIPVRRPEP